MRVSLKFLASVLTLGALIEHGFAQQAVTGNPADTGVTSFQDFGTIHTQDSNIVVADTGNPTDTGVTGIQDFGATHTKDSKIVITGSRSHSDTDVAGIQDFGVTHTQDSNIAVADTPQGTHTAGGIGGNGEAAVTSIDQLSVIPAEDGSTGGTNGGVQTTNGVVANGVSLGGVGETNAVQRKPSNSGGRSKLNANRRRMLRSRRLREKIKRLRRGRKKNGKPPANGAQNSQQPVIAATPPTVPAEQALPLVSNIQTNQVVQQQPQPEIKPAPKPSKEQDGFFDFFETTTTVPDAAVPPPEFDPNKPPKKKTIQKVDMSKSTAHDGSPCNATYKPHPTIKTQYMMKYAEGVWETLDCPPNLAEGLVWRQDLCNCGEELRPQDPDDWCGMAGYSAYPGNRHKYSRRDHGVDAVMSCAATLVWSQQKCQCMYDPNITEKPIEQSVNFECNKILHLEFEGNLKNTAKGFQVRPVRLPNRGKLKRIRYIKTPGSTNRTAMIVSQPIELEAFKGNDFQKQVTYALNFKISPKHRSRTKFMLLLTDECLSAKRIQGKGRKPSISLGFQPSSKSFRLRFRTTEAEVDKVITGAKPDKNGWYKPVVYFEDRTVNLENNGQLLFNATEILGKVPRNRCPLYIAGRGRGFKRSMDFYGYMDNVLVKQTDL